MQVIIALSPMLLAVIFLSSYVRPESTKSNNTNAISTSTSANNTTTRQVLISKPNAAPNVSATIRANFSRWFCYGGSKPVPMYKSRCCQFEYTRFEGAWYNGGYYITTLLERLERWECDQFKVECEKRTYNFTTYTDLVYDRFCDRKLMEWKCKSEVNEVVVRYQFLNSTNTKVTHSWSTLANSLRSSEMDMRDWASPCVQIAIFESSGGGVGRIHEIVETYFPFCGLKWNGYDIDTAVNITVSAWTSLNVGCELGVAICIGLMTIAGIATITANLTILVVFAVRPKLRNTQSIYQMSVAVADLVVGLMVWPNMIVIQVLLFIKPRMMGEIITTELLTRNGRTAFFPNANDSLERRFPGGGFGSTITRPYINYLGFFTSLGITVSIYTLMAASIDRLWAVSYPIKYIKHNGKKHAKIACVTIWILAVLSSLLPVFGTSLEFSVISSILISTEGTSGNILLLVTFILPLIATWAVSVATLEISRRYSKKRQAIFSASNRHAASIERQLARTLGLMVGVFSISVLPAIICIVASLSLQTTNWSNPQRLNVLHSNIYTSAEYISIIILTANSLWNCFIYSGRNAGFREATIDIYKKIFCVREMACIGRGDIRDAASPNSRSTIA